MAVATYTKAGAKATTAAKLDKSVFAVMPTDHTLLKDAYTAYLANGRKNLAVAKTRGDVSGGGRKPWRQKGTGRARFGSSRNPIWRGGGAAFGPTGQENYTKHLNLKAKRQALRQALSLAAQDNKIKVIETFDCKDGKAGRTAELLKKVDAHGSVLLAVTQKDELVERATRNLPAVKAVHAKYLNVFDILNADTIILSEEALDEVTAWLSGGTQAVVAKETKS
jgi:large subunit ribosomal protein L4